MPDLNDWDKMSQDLDEDEGNPAESWRPEPGEYLAGTLLRVDQRPTEYGEARFAILKDRDGNDWSVLMKTVIQREWERQAPLIGDMVGVKYFGPVIDHDPKTGKEKIDPKTHEPKVRYQKYSVRVLRAEENVIAARVQAQAREDARNGVTTAPAAQGSPNLGKPVVDDSDDDYLPQ